MNKINVCFSSDNNYAKYCGVAITSILANANEDDDINIYILDGGIEESKRQEIQSLKNIKNCNITFVKIDENLFNDYKDVETHKHLSLAAYYRLKMAALLPNIQRIVYFDCDFTICTSLKELFELDLGNNVIAGVLDVDKRKLKRNPNYINSGMIVFDLNKIRQENIEEKFLDYTKKNINNIKLGDQEIINAVLNGRILHLEGEWNLQSSNFINRSSYSKHPKAIHMLAKPWRYASACYHRNEYFKYLQMTPWALNEEEYKHWTVDNQRDSLIKYFKRRPLFFLRPRFYYALYKTYIEK